MSRADENKPNRSAGSGDPAYNTRPVGPVPPPGVPPPGVPARGAPSHEGHTPPPAVPPACRLRRLHRVWPDRDGNISYLLTLCVDGRVPVLNNDVLFERFVAFLIDSPARYRWFGRRFVVMPDHLHLIAHMGYDAVRLGQWIKAMKAVVGGLEPRPERPVRAPGLQDPAVGPVSPPAAVGPVPPPGAHSRVPLQGAPHPFSRLKRPWRWQDGFHDHKFRTREAEARKWEYICLNPVRARLVERPEQWPFGGEIFYDETGGPHLVRGTPPLLEAGLLVEADGTLRGSRPISPGECPGTPGECPGTPGESPGTPGQGTRPTTQTL